MASSAAATAATTVVIAALGKLQCGRASAALNATSHIVWGEDAKRRDDTDVRHTLVGALLNAAAMVSWATVQHLFFPRPRTRLGGFAVGALVAGLAYVTDYYLVPKRLTPGFEARLSRAGLATVYAALAASLAATARSPSSRFTA